MVNAWDLGLMLPQKQTEYKPQKNPHWKLVIENISSYSQKKKKKKMLPQEPKETFEGLVALRKKTDWG